VILFFRWRTDGIAVVSTEENDGTIQHRGREVEGGTFSKSNRLPQPSCPPFEVHTQHQRPEGSGFPKETRWCGN
jgi:hypothetical protein